MFKSVPTSAELIFLRVFPGHENSIFGNPAEMKSLKSEFFSTQSSKVIGKNLLFWKNSIYLQNVSRDALNAPLTAMPEKFW